MNDKVERQGDILERYEKGEIEKDPDVSELAEDYDVNSSTIEQDLRDLRAFMRSQEYDGDRPPIYPVKVHKGQKQGAIGNDAKDWKTKINKKTVS